MTRAMSMMPLAFSTPGCDGITRSYLELLTAYSEQHPTTPTANPTADNETFALCTVCCEVFDTFNLVITGDAVTNRTQILCADCLSSSITDGALM